LRLQLPWSRREVAGSLHSYHFSYEACWPAVMKDTDGVILVYNPESHVHESEAMLWFVRPRFLRSCRVLSAKPCCWCWPSRYEWFMQNAGLDTSQCLVLEHSTGSSNAALPLASKSRLPSHLRVVATTFDTPHVFKSEFGRLVSAALERQQRAGSRK